MVRGYLNENFEVTILYKHGVYVRLRLRFLVVFDMWYFGGIQMIRDSSISVAIENSLGDLLEV